MANLVWDGPHAFDFFRDPSLAGSSSHGVGVGGYRNDCESHDRRIGESDDSRASRERHDEA